MLASLKKANQTLQNGELVILHDDLITNDNAFVGLTEHVSPHNVNFMARIGKGLICVIVTRAKAEELDLQPMVEDNGLHSDSIPFTISVDYKTTTTGISSFERHDTIRAFGLPDVHADDFNKPGHIFPLVSHDHGLLQKITFVNASMELAKTNSAVLSSYLCKILNDNGEMASFEEITKISEKYQIPLIKMSELLQCMDRTINTYEVVGNQIVANPLDTQNINVHFDKDSEKLDGGVYGVEVTADDKQSVGVMTVSGVRDGQERDEMHEITLHRAEACFQADRLQVKVCFYLREEMPFYSLSEIIRQKNKDLKAVMERFELCEKKQTKP